LPEENVITTNDKSTITAARQAYEALADKSGINTDKLTKAEAKIRELEAAEAERSRLETEAKAAKGNVINLIANIPEENAITTNDKSTIIAARQAYEALADKSGIDTNKLTKAEAKIKALETAEVERSQQIQNIQSQIDKLSGYTV
jgi:ParB-like chromosome segregation protein Spo0J